MLRWAGLVSMSLFGDFECWKRIRKGMVRRDEELTYMRPSKKVMLMEMRWVRLRCRCEMK